MNNEEKDKILIKFEDGDISLDVKVSPNEDTVWLTQEQMALLFNVDRTRIVRHINNIYSDNELDMLSTCAENAQVQFEGARQVKRKIKIYNLDMITAIGYRIKSSRTTKFKEWALNEIEKLKNQNSQKMALSQYILFNYDEIKLNVNVDPDKDTVWLNKNQLIILFDTTRQNLEYHINRDGLFYEAEFTSSKVCTALNDLFNFGLDKKYYQNSELTKLVKKI